MKFQPTKVGLYTGVLISSFHSFWSILVVLGLSQGLLDFIYSIHFLNNPFQIQQFSLTTALILIVFTFAVGFIVGWVGTWLWNKMQSK